MTYKTTWLGLAALCCLTGAAFADVPIYPEGGHNLRVPMIPPVDGGAKGKCIPFEEVTFGYQVAPLLPPESQGDVRFSFRDNLRRGEKRPLELLDAEKNGAALVVSPAFEGRKLMLAAIRGGKVVRRVPLTLDSVPGQWLPAELSWQGREVRLALGGKQATLTLDRDFAPSAFQVAASLIDELQWNQPAGRIALDWEKDYNARLAAKSGAAGGVRARLLGLDSMVVSSNPAGRDFPVVAVTNTGAKPVVAKVHFALTGELGDFRQDWVQEIAVPAGASVEAPIRIPFERGANVYHLTARCDNPVLDTTAHFLYAPRRNEAKGDAKMGLHDVNGADFGFWPDALAFDYAHKYLRWGYVQGPAWVKDRDGGKSYGLDPVTVPESEWNWNSNLDWELLSGRKMFVCLQSGPWMDWMRAKNYPRMYDYPWGKNGGAPKLDLAARFIRAAAARYHGKVTLWEIENEPNTDTAYGKFTDDYVATARMVYGELKKADPANFVFGISGTSNFAAWMKPVWAAGGAQAMDGVSWHTYSNPKPDDGLLDMIAEAKKVASDKKRFFNSETGLLCAMREKVDQALPHSYVEKCVAARTPGFVSRPAWPGRVYDERAAGSGMVRNAVLNFRSGVEAFVIFGWNLTWPNARKPWPQQDPDFAAFAITPDGVRTPSLFTLAMGVLANQMEGVLLRDPVAIDQLCLRGGVFHKADGGKVAAVWPLIPVDAILAVTTVPEMETVGLLGDRGRSVGAPISGGRYMHKLNLKGEPIYCHLPPGAAIEFPPPAVEKVSSGPGAPGFQTVTLSLFNESNAPRRFTVKPGNPAVKPDSATLSLPPKGRGPATFTVPEPAPGGAKEFRETFIVDDGTGTGYSHPVELQVRPRLTVGRIPDNPPLPTYDSLKLPEYRLDRAEQVVVGAPPKLASLQESVFWGGPAELSGQVKAGYNQLGLYFAIRVHDQVARPDKNFPGIHGSVLELFTDFRKPGKGLGKSLYSAGVRQFLIQPGAEPKVWSPQLTKTENAGIRCSSTPLGKDYAVVVFIPWRLAGLKPEPGTVFGFDLGINAPWPDKDERKSQIMLFGTAGNARDASAFGTAILE